MRSPASATVPTRSASSSPTCTTRATRRCCSSRPSSAWPWRRGSAVREELLRPEPVPGDDDPVVLGDGAEVDGGVADVAGLRPRTLEEFVGQRELKEHLRI